MGQVTKEQLQSICISDDVVTDLNVDTLSVMPYSEYVEISSEHTTDGIFFFTYES